MAISTLLYSKIGYLTVDVYQGIEIIDWRQVLPLPILSLQYGEEKEPK